MRLLLVGGLGRMEPQYRRAAEALGHELLYAEQRLSAPPRVDRILICTTT